MDESNIAIIILRNDSHMTDDSSAGIGTGKKDQVACMRRLPVDSKTIVGKVDGRAGYFQTEVMRNMIYKSGTIKYFRRISRCIEIGSANIRFSVFHER